MIRLRARPECSRKPAHDANGRRAPVRGRRNRRCCVL